MVIDGKTRKVEKIFPVPPEACELPQGMTIGPHNQILLGCDGASPNGHPNTVAIIKQKAEQYWRASRTWEVPTKSGSMRATATTSSLVATRRAALIQASSHGATRDRRRQRSPAGPIRFNSGECRHVLGHRATLGRSRSDDKPSLRADPGNHAGLSPRHRFAQTATHKVGSPTDCDRLHCYLHDDK